MIVIRGLACTKGSPVIYKHGREKQCIRVYIEIVSNHSVMQYSCLNSFSYFLLIPKFASRVSESKSRTSLDLKSWTVTIETRIGREKTNVKYVSFEKISLK